MKPNTKRLITGAVLVAAFIAINLRPHRVVAPVPTPPRVVAELSVSEGFAGCIASISLNPDACNMCGAIGCTITNNLGKYVSFGCPDTSSHGVSAGDTVIANISEAVCGCGVVNPWGIAHFVDVHGNETESPINMPQGWDTKLYYVYVSCPSGGGGGVTLQPLSAGHKCILE